jgi:peptidyl-prolyl cis-trans isomerase D
MLIEHLLERVYVGKADDLLDQLVAQLQTQYDVRIDQTAVAQALTR